MPEPGDHSSVRFKRRSTQKFVIMEKVPTPDTIIIRDGQLL